MLKRKALKLMDSWKKNKTHQALLVSGARQVGKTFLIREFCRRNYKNIVEINLIEDEGAAEALSTAKNSSELFMRISTYAHSSLTQEQSVVFIDEIQAAPQIITQLKFLVEKNKVDYIVSGSLLGIELKSVRSFPVGYMSEIRMYPLDFEEFCWAAGLNEDVFAQVKQDYVGKTPVDSFIHAKMLDLFHKYIVCGGMPDVVNEFTKNEDVLQVRDLQNNIITLYRDDISKYAGDRARVVKRIFDLMLSEISRQDKRFLIKDVEGSSRFNRYDNDFMWLCDAGVAIPVYDVNEPRYPLLAQLETSRFKLFLNDIGLLSCESSMDVVRDVLMQRKDINYGALYENVVAQELLAHGHGGRDGSLAYFKNHRLGELDFIIQTNSSTILPIEVKSGKSYNKHSALNNVLSTQNYSIDQAIVLSERNLEQDDKITYLPIYMIMFL